MLFASHKIFKDALRENVVLEGKDIKFQKNEKVRVTAVCKKDCGWRIHASKLVDVDTFQIKTMNPKHTCGRSYCNAQASAKWIGKKYIENFRDDATWKVGAFINSVRRDYKVDISETKAYRARRSAVRQVQGDYAEQYGHLWDYCETLRVYNSGSYVKLKVNTPRPGMLPRFERLFVLLAAQREGFLTSCRPFIGLDGCFLKGPFGGVLLTAIGRDGNDNFYPICMAVVEAECKSSWIWFLENMIFSLGMLDACTFISDRQKGLLEAFQAVIPNVDHRFYVRHLYANFRDAGFRGKSLKDELWGAAVAITRSEFDMKMNAIKQLNVVAYEYLSNINPNCWSRHGFSPRSKCDLVVNNLTESFNAYILDAREKPIITMVEQIRTMLMNRYHKKREGIANLNQNFPPKIQSKLEVSNIQASNYRAICAGIGLFQVSCDNKSYVVSLNARTCGCRKWDISGIPCGHAISAIYEDLRQPEEFVNEVYKKEFYLRAYVPMVFPVPSKEQWVHTELPIIEAPKPRKAPGRPKKCRKGGAEEPKKGSSVRFRHESLRCSNCMKYGHNVRTCKQPLNTNRKVQKRRRKNVVEHVQGSSNNEVGEESNNATGPVFVQNEVGIGVSYEQADPSTMRRKVVMKRKKLAHRNICPPFGTKRNSTQHSSNSSNQSSVQVGGSGSCPTSIDVTSSSIQVHTQPIPKPTRQKLPFRSPVQAIPQYTTEPQNNLQVGMTSSLNTSRSATQLRDVQPLRRSPRKRATMRNLAHTTLQPPAQVGVASSLNMSGNAIEPKTTIQLPAQPLRRSPRKKPNWRL